MCESEPGIVVEQTHRHHQVPGNRLRVAFVQAQQVPPHDGVEIGRLHFFRQIGFLRTRRAAFQGTVPAGTGPFAAPATVLRRVAARRPVLAIRPGLSAIAFATLETGVTALIGITTTLEPTPLARLTTPGIASVAGIVTATVEPTAGIAAIEPAAGTGVTARAEPAPRIVATLAGITPAFEAAAVARILIALESASLPGPASTSGTATARGFLPALETTALGCVAAATEATGVTTPAAGLLTFEPTALARTAALVVTAAVVATA